MPYAVAGIACCGLVASLSEASATSSVCNAVVCLAHSRLRAPVRYTSSTPTVGNTVPPAVCGLLASLCLAAAASTVEDTVVR